MWRRFRNARTCAKGSVDDVQVAETLHVWELFGCESACRSMDGVETERGGQLCGACSVLKTLYMIYVIRYDIYELQLFPPGGSGQ